MKRSICAVLVFLCVQGLRGQPVSGSYLQLDSTATSGMTRPAAGFGRVYSNGTGGLYYRAVNTASNELRLLADSRKLAIGGTVNEIDTSPTGGLTLSQDRTWTISLPTTIDLGGKTSFEIPNGSAPTTDAFGEIAGKNNAWGTNRGAAQFYDGTANTYLIGVLASSSPSNGTFPQFQSNTIAWASPESINVDQNWVGYFSTANTTIKNGFYWENSNKTIGVDKWVGLATTASFHSSKASGANDIFLDVYGSNSSLTSQAAGGTRASPSATASGQQLLNLDARGYVSAFTTTKARISFVAAETWGSTANGTKIQVAVTPAGSTSMAAVTDFTSNGIEVRPNFNLRIYDSDGSNVAILNPVNLSGNRTYDLPDASGDMAIFSSTGYGVRTADNTFTTRTITGGSAIKVTNGDGVSGNTTIAGVPLVWTAMADGSNRAWTNKPAAVTELVGATLHRSAIDLTNATQFRVSVVVAAGSGLSNSDIGVQFSTNSGTNWSGIDNGTSNAMSDTKISDNNSGLQVSSWGNLNASAKADVWVRIVGDDGDGAADPAYGLITIQFK